MGASVARMHVHIRHSFSSHGVKVSFSDEVRGARPPGMSALPSFLPHLMRSSPNTGVWNSVLDVNSSLAEVHQRLHRPFHITQIERAGWFVRPIDTVLPPLPMWSF